MTRQYDKAADGLIREAVEDGGIVAAAMIALESYGWKSYGFIADATPCPVTSPIVRQVDEVFAREADEVRSRARLDRHPGVRNDGAGHAGAGRAVRAQAGDPRVPLAGAPAFARWVHELAGYRSAHGLARKMKVSFVCAVAIVSACGRGESVVEHDPRSGPRDLSELQRMMRDPRACGDHGDCPVGSHCDDETCTWACLADSECGDGRQCDTYGICAPAFGPMAMSNLTAASTACQSIPAADRRAALVALFEDAQLGSFVVCDGDETCPCGSFCSVDAVCRVDCIAIDPIPELTCGSGLSCTGLGRCATSPTDPGPSLSLTIALSEIVTERNTASAPVLVPLTVTVAATSLAALSPTNPAVVKLSIAEVRAAQQGLADPPAIAPRVKCSANAPLTADCEIAGGWTFDVSAGQLRSAPKPIWVEIPQTTTPHEWTLEARSEWAADPAVDIIKAAPVIVPATDPGRYRGTIGIENLGAQGADTAILELPVEAIVTPTHIAVFEPTRVVFGDGHVVFSRDPTKSTLVGWIAAGAHRYDIGVAIAQSDYDTTSGHLDINFASWNGTGADAPQLSLSLERSGNGDAPPCPCGSGSYCNAAMARCLPGAGPPSGGGIVSSSSAGASVMLPSAIVANWTDPLSTVATNPLLAGSGIAGIERAYCFENGGQPGAARFGDPTINATSGDLSCKRGGVDPNPYAQTTFPLADRPREYAVGTGNGVTFDLFEKCTTELRAQPTGSASTANLLPTRDCVSVGRFLLAMNANVVAGVGQPLNDIGHRLVEQLLRQWLGVHSYVASSATQVRRYDDVLDVEGDPAHVRLGSALALVEAGLRVLLDARVRPQYATGADVPVTMAKPDYRIAPRPVARWAFNTAQNPVPPVDGTIAFTIPQGIAPTGDLFVTNSQDTTCRSAAPVVLDDRRFSIVANLTYAPGLNVTTIVLDKLAPNGDRLWIEASSPDLGLHMTLTLKDSRGGSATFPPVSSGLIAIVVDGPSHRIFQGSTNAAAIAVVGGGPRWGAAGPVTLACEVPPNTQTCTSWDRNVAGDQLDVVIRPNYWGRSQTYRQTCTETQLPPKRTCTGSPPSAAFCASAAQMSAHRTKVIQSLWPSAPAWAVNAISVTNGTLVMLGSGSSAGSNTLTEWQDWACDFLVSKRPEPVTATKPVCPKAPTPIRWDEVALWSRPVSHDEFKAMVALYGGNAMAETLPAPIPTPLAGMEQATALPVHILEAASADLDLLSDYIEAERAVMYGECYLGGGSPARDRVLDVAGANLRLVTILEGEAIALAGNVPSTTVWIPRYLAAHRQLAGRRAKIVGQIQLATECANPLGITEDELPLFVGEAVGEVDKFFASSSFLAAKAKEEIAIAQSKLVVAREKYMAQRQTAYQLDAARESKTLRETKLRADFESVLLRYCGKPAGSQKLLDGFLAGTLNASNCFIKTEFPLCTNVVTAKLEDTPASCMRGEIGARLLAARTAALDAANAGGNLRRTIEQYDADMTYCARRQEFLHQDEALLAAHQNHMSSLRSESRWLSLAVGLVGGFAKLQLADWLDFGASIKELWNERDKTLFSTGTGALGAIGGFFEAQLAEDEAAEKERYQAQILARSHALDMMECFHKVDSEKFAIDAAGDAIKRAHQQVQVATYDLDNLRNAISGIVDEAAGQLAIEAGIDSTPPHLHYWLDLEISDFHRHMEYARRLTYLALRAFEYESQQSLFLRSDVLGASLPEQLLAVATEIDLSTEPMQGELGMVIGGRPVVLSLRDEILRMADIANASQALPGEPPMTPEQAFKRYLASESSRILDANGNYLGRGIRFSLRPEAWTETSCAERIWRLTPSLQIDNPPTQHGMVLYQDNQFGSQDCRAPFGTVMLARADLATNLLTGDAAAFATPSASTAMNIDGPLGLDHETLRQRPPGDLAGFAGRGLYSTYVLLFPKLTWSDLEVAKIKDVLLRFDIVEVTHAPPL